MIEINPLAREDFNPVYQLMCASFPPVERRSYKAAQALLDLPDYRIYVASAAGQKIAGFIAEWQLDGLLFLEHLAVQPALRGSGIGSNMVKRYLDHVDRPVVLEVEEPNSRLAARRIHFYQKLGFKLSDYGYVQPNMQPVNEEPVALKIMHYPDGMTEKEFLQFKKMVSERVYQLKKTGKNG